MGSSVFVRLRVPILCLVVLLPAPFAAAEAAAPSGAAAAVTAGAPGAGAPPAATAAAPTGAAPAAAAAPAGLTAADPAEVQRQLAAARLEPERAVQVKGVKMNAGLARLSLDEGVVIPASRIAGRSRELLFVGRGRFVLEPPDAIEAGQLDLFTGRARLDEEFSEAVLVVGLDGAVDALLRRPAAAADPVVARRAEAAYGQWRKERPRKLLGIEGGLLVDAAGDPSYQGYFAAWLRGTPLGEFLYLVDPDSREQVTLGRFVPLDATDKEKEKIRQQLSKEQRKGRLVGLAVEDLGQWDTWVSSSLRDREGRPSPGAPSFEPARYTLDVTLGEDLRLAGKARLELTPVRRGARSVQLHLGRDFEVTKVRDGGGGELFSFRSGEDLTVVLPRSYGGGETAQVEIEYAGRPVAKDWNLYHLEGTLGWYPHAGAVDRARYDVTLRWPKALALVASGRRAGGGDAADGSHWERRTIDLPVLGFTFEVGRFKLESVRAGHVQVTFAFDPAARKMDGSVRQEIIAGVTGALPYYEGLFGPYPLDELTVVTVPRGFSQSTLGLVTLSDAMMEDYGFLGYRLIRDLPDRRAIIAHELAHQWWGDVVGWASYRDQWISEAMADYCALLFVRAKLDPKESPVPITASWQKSLSEASADGREVESIGPVVLGTRLMSSLSEDAYTAIVYDKGAVVLDMLAGSLGEESFPKVLQQVFKAAAGSTLSTEDLLALVERVTSTDLSAFAKRFVYGTGMPEVFYSYQFQPAANGRWRVTGKARQATPHRFRYRLVKSADGGLDIARQGTAQVDVASSTLVAPLAVAFHDPKRDPRGNRKGDPNATLHTTVVLRGEATDLDFELDGEPRQLWLDKQGQVFARFVDERRHPKLVLFLQGVNAAAAGKAEEAEALYRKALATDEAPPETGETRYYQDIQLFRRLFNAQIQFGLARLALERGRDREAQDALGRADIPERVGGWLAGERSVLESWLDVRQGQYDRVFKRLNRKVPHAARAEGYLLLAIAAQKTGHAEEYERAIKRAREHGADLRQVMAAAEPARAPAG